MKAWLQESSTNRSEMNLTGAAFTSCRLTHQHQHQHQRNEKCSTLSFSFYSCPNTERDIFILKFLYHVPILLFLTQSQTGLWGTGCLVAAKRWCLQGALLWLHSRSPCAACRRVVTTPIEQVMKKRICIYTFSLLVICLFLLSFLLTNYNSIQHTNKTSHIYFNLMHARTLEWLTKTTF